MQAHLKAEASRETNDPISLYLFILLEMILRLGNMLVPSHDINVDASPAYHNDQ